MTLRERRAERQAARYSKVGGRLVPLVAACVAALALCGLGVASAGANAKRGLSTGFADFATNGFNSHDPAVRAVALDEVLATEADTVRIHAGWPSIAETEPQDPRDPADPAYRFAPLDAKVRDATARGLRVLIIIVHAPSWAEGPDRPPESETAPPWTWKPRVGPSEDFGHAIARRYSGSFSDPANPGQALPRVRHFQVFNEPNLRLNLTPQWEGNQPTSALVYRRVLNAFYQGIKGVHASNVVVTAGTAPYGTERNHPLPRMRPLDFWRTVMCLRPNLRAQPCPEPAHFDVLAHQPINTSGGPFDGALHRDDISSPDMWKLRRALRAAERQGTIRPGGRRPLWATEFWWETDPPDMPRVGPRGQARRIQESLYLFWRDGVGLALNYRVRDGTDPDRFARNTTGVYRTGGARKPAFRTFRFPFVALKRGRRVELWGKAPRRGRVAIHARRGGGKWRRVTRVRSGGNRVFRSVVRMRGRPQLQARVRGGGRSLVYRVRQAPPPPG